MLDGRVVVYHLRRDYLPRSLAPPAKRLLLAMAPRRLRPTAGGVKKAGFVGLASVERVEAERAVAPMGGAISRTLHKFGAPGTAAYR
jgi:hypothetical protein